MLWIAEQPGIKDTKDSVFNIVENPQTVAKLLFVEEEISAAKYLKQLARKPKIFLYKSLTIGVKFHHVSVGPKNRIGILPSPRSTFIPGDYEDGHQVLKFSLYEFICFDVLCTSLT